MMTDSISPKKVLIYALVDPFFPPGRMIFASRIDAYGDGPGSCSRDRRAQPRGKNPTTRESQSDDVRKILARDGWLVWTMTMWQADDVNERKGERLVGTMFEVEFKAAGSGRKCGGNC